MEKRKCSCSALDCHTDRHSITGKKIEFGFCMNRDSEHKNREVFNNETGLDLCEECILDDTIPEE